MSNKNINKCQIKILINVGDFEESAHGKNSDIWNQKNSKEIYGMPQHKIN